MNLPQWITLIANVATIIVGLSFVLWIVLFERRRR